MIHINNTSKTEQQFIVGRFAGGTSGDGAFGWSPEQSGVNRGQREHNGSFTGYPQKGVVRCSLDSTGNLPP